MISVCQLFSIYFFFHFAIQLTTQEKNYYHLESSVDEPLVEIPAPAQGAVIGGELVTIHHHQAMLVRQDDACDTRQDNNNLNKMK